MKYLIIAFHICLALLFIAYCEKKIAGEEAETLWFMLVQIMPATLTMTFGYCVVKKNIRFVELMGVNLLGTQMLVIVFNNYSGLFEMDQFLHYCQIDISYMYFLFYIGLLTTQFKWHMLGRSLLILPSYLVLLIVT